MKGGRKRFKKKGGGGVQKVLPCLEGGGGRAQKVSDPRFSHFVAPLQVINDQSLKVSDIFHYSLKKLTSLAFSILTGLPQMVTTPGTWVRVQVRQTDPTKARNEVVNMAATTCRRQSFLRDSVTKESKFILLLKIGLFFVQPQVDNQSGPKCDAL